MIIKIIDRAADMHIIFHDRSTLLMDLENADNQFNLRLGDLLNADTFNFGHDVIGIQQYINRSTGAVNGFIPRFATA